MSSEKISNGAWVTILVAIIGAAGLIIAPLLDRRSDGSVIVIPSGDNTNVRTLSVSSTPVADPPAVKPERLIEIIKEQQQQKVRESYGEWEGQNFSDDNLQDFIRRGIAAEVAEQLKSNNEFLEVVLAIKRMSPTDRQKLLDKASITYKQTWTELGRVDRKGQTEAGQKAEKMIAEAIVNKVKELSKLPDEEIRKLYT